MTSRTPLLLLLLLLLGDMATCRERWCFLMVLVQMSGKGGKTNGGQGRFTKRTPP